ncbi:unnamed protein product [Linum trigynum]|uniref:NHL repeat-containing protein n=1 Tax=Linum trigynum TaxID=586398 RepID=A0AAV2GTE9_9ROSI
MAAAPSLFYFLLALVTASLFLSVEAGLILEDGYTVTTVIDGHDLNINPYHVLPLPHSSDLVVLNYATGVFYSAAFPTSSKEVVLRPLAGDGKLGFSDGELTSAQFNKPKNFAVDLKGNVYVADKANHAIRKISSSGVTTIAGGYSNKIGNKDGPAQNATFSNDFELVFVAQQCALLVADHGNQLVRQITLKSEDCTTASPGSQGVGAAPWWILGLALSCVFGIAVGFAIRPYVLPRLRGRPSNNPFWFSKTWKLWIIKLVKEAWTLCSDIRNGAASLKLYALLRRLLLLSMSHVSLMFRINNPVGSPPTPSKDFVSLIDSDMSNSSSSAKSDVFASELKELMPSDNSRLLSNTDEDNFKFGEADDTKTISVAGGIDSMIEANIRGFAFSMKEPALLEGSVVANLGLIKRR